MIAINYDIPTDTTVMIVSSSGAVVAFLSDCTTGSVSSLTNDNSCGTATVEYMEVFEDYEICDTSEDMVLEPASVWVPRICRRALEQLWIVMPKTLREHLYAQYWSGFT